MPVRVLGPDGQTYNFPDSTDKAAAVSYFKSKGITGPKPPQQPGPVSRFASSALDSSGLSGVGHAIAHPIDTITSIPGAVAGEAKRVVGEGREIMDAQKRGDVAGGIYHGVKAIPVIGPAMDKAADQYADKDYAGEMGTLTGVTSQPLIGEGVGRVVKAVSKVPGAVSRFADRPQNVGLTPSEVAAQKLVKALIPEERDIPNIKSASPELPDALAAAQRKGLPINGKGDLGKAVLDRAGDIQSHFDDKLLRPHSGKFQTVPEGYGGELSGNGRNQATLGQINDRINGINTELKSNFRKPLASQTAQANAGASDAELIAEKNGLTQILHQKLGDMNGLAPEDIASVRQRAGKLRSLGEQIVKSSDKDTLSLGRQEAGSSFSPSKSGLIEKGMQYARGGQEVIGNKAIKDALDSFPPEDKPLPQPVPPDSTQVPTTPEAAQAEFLRSNELEQSSQDAAAARNAEAERLRAGNVGRQQDAAKAEVVKAVEGEQGAQDASAQRGTVADDVRRANEASRMGMTPPAPTATPIASPSPSAGPIALPPPELPTIGEKEVVPADPSKGIQSVSLPVVESPETHVYSKSAHLQADPEADVDEAAAAAKQAGYEVQE